MGWEEWMKKCVWKVNKKQQEKRDERGSGQDTNSVRNNRDRLEDT